jgi:integrase/recombinase XerD
MDTLFAQFCKEKEYLQGCSPRTVKFYKFCYMSWKKLSSREEQNSPHRDTERPTKQAAQAYVISLRESGISIFTINSYIRGLNSFFTWLAENDHCEKVRMKPLKAPKSVPKTFSEAEVRLLLSFKPKTFFEHRLYAMVATALDTGCRVDELITLQREKVDFDNLLIRVIGKGNKERLIPISPECRKTLFKFLQRHDFTFVFPTLYGGKVYYRSALTQFRKLCEKQGVKLGGWHQTRHTFATNYLRQGGNVIYLQRLLGHTDLSTTQIYVENNIDDLALVHARTSLLSRLQTRL